MDYPKGEAENELACAYAKGTNFDKDDNLMYFLKDQHIGSGIYYEKGLNDAKITDIMTKQVLSLPCYPELTVLDQLKVIQGIHLFARGN